MPHTFMHAHTPTPNLWFWPKRPPLAKMAWDVLSGVTKTAWDDLSGVANRCGMFCPGWQKMAWDVLSRDVLSYIRSRSICHKNPRQRFFSSFLVVLHLFYRMPMVYFKENYNFPRFQRGSAIFSREGGGSNFF